MAKSFKLDDLRDDIDKQFEPVVIEVNDDVFVLRNFTRMDKESRAAAQALMTGMDDEKTNMGSPEFQDTLNELLKIIVADFKGQGLIDLIGDDLAMTLKVFNVWVEGTGLGEASRSQERSTNTEASSPQTSNGSTDSRSGES